MLNDGGPVSSVGGPLDGVEDGFDDSVLCSGSPWLRGGGSPLSGVQGA
jgi:hypothetical protein